MHCFAFRFLKDTLLAAYVDMQYPLIPIYSASLLSSKSAASYPHFPPCNTDTSNTAFATVSSSGVSMSTTVQRGSWEDVDSSSNHYLFVIA